MPVTHFRVRWPDQRETLCYSPSSVVSEHLEAGAAYPLPEFLDRARSALNQASERVRRRYGFACSAAQDQLDVIEATAARFAGQAGATVTVLAFER
ncbi:hypothetical protein BKK79_21480 [Cupriavidus sp. USMAA2-4]|uniref:MSMEG_0570 family nitrogen starvation response protein n=1 Tax=Cupriavidus sp. USMAA2-4 TaxID=876364 RepID=UPI0008A6B734|nr:MSMEG_0570 family nitrogen starvation response protein [Cupriavidus sp. USMAA2-4]AOY94517.1 hypothetical protein BKK79_21480 [Cupriavidus sp. USMAA2-4]